MSLSGKIEEDTTFEVKEDWDNMNLPQGTRIHIDKEFSIRGSHFIVVNVNDDVLDIPLYEFMLAYNTDIIKSV